MPNYRFLQLDVFTDRAFCGNPLAVFPEAEGLTDEQQLKIAREMNLSETVFVLKEASDNALRRLRIYTPMREIPFAGHPIVGTWTALAQEGVVPLPDGGNGWQRIFHEVGIGILPLDIEFNDGKPVQVVMTQGKFEIIDEIDDAQEQAEVARALGLNREDLDESLPIQVITTGLSCLAVPVRSLADLRDTRINTSLLSEIYTRHGGTGCHAFTRETIDVGASRAHARFFAPADNIPEDPATGSACGALGAYLVHHGGLTLEPEDGKYKFVIEQGDFINRPSRINLEVKGEAGRVEEVRVGGPAVLVARGEVIF
jgi:trans-2,3-dihydro-3-hydroxyanthranilate isomerase